MRTFNDSAGRTWQIPAITVGDIRRVRKECGVLICNLKDGQPQLMLRLQDDMPLLAEVVFVLTGPAKTGVTLDQFLASLDAVAIAAMEEAFWQEMFDFFLPCRPGIARMILQTFGVTVPSGSGSLTSPATSE